VEVLADLGEKLDGDERSILRHGRGDAGEAEARPAGEATKRDGAVVEAGGSTPQLKGPPPPADPRSAMDCTNGDNVLPSGARTASSEGAVDGVGDVDEELVWEKTTLTPNIPLGDGEADSGHVTDDEPPLRLRIIARRRQQAAGKAAAEWAELSAAQASQRLLASLGIFPASCPIAEDDAGHGEGGSDDDDQGLVVVRSATLPGKGPVPLSRKRLNAIMRFRARRGRLQSPSPAAPPPPPPLPLVWQTKSDFRALHFAPPTTNGLAFNLNRLAAIRRFRKRRFLRGGAVAKAASKEVNPAAGAAAGTAIWALEKRQAACTCTTCSPRSLASAVAHQGPQREEEHTWGAVSPSAGGELLGWR
jgi:hypothetical protein